MIGVDLTVTQALALSVAGAITVAIGFFPGGLGVREALIAALSPLIGLDLESGVLLGCRPAGVARRSRTRWGRAGREPTPHERRFGELGQGRHSTCSPVTGELDAQQDTLRDGTSRRGGE